MFQYCNVFLMLLSVIFVEKLMSGQNYVKMNSDIYFLTCKINKINLSCSHTKVAVVWVLLLHSFVSL